MRELKKLGATCVMASVDPFHIEFVPLERSLLLVRELRAVGFDYFIMLGMKSTKACATLERGDHDA